MSEANPPVSAAATKKLGAARDVTRAVLELFELLVANARDTGNNIAELEAWADEWKPRLEKHLR